MVLGLVWLVLGMVLPYSTHNAHFNNCKKEKTLSLEKGCFEELMSLLDLCLYLQKRHYPHAYFGCVEHNLGLDLLAYYI